MRLKNLEIFGFKSFAAKTVFSFPANITAIVGPNGSGKSNVVDAIRWVLGERDLKSLRVARSEDIIFGGTPGRSRMSLAHVSIVLDNGDSSLPVDYKEVCVSRKINRDGESEYLINQSQVRLKDVVEILAKAKIGSQGMTIINQGSADSILKASPKERRMMLEESFGLREFQMKKEESKRKLIATEENLSQVRSLLEELLPHLRSLRRQVGRWQKREETISELGICEKIFFGAQIFDLRKSRTESKNKFFELKKNIEKEELVLSDLDGEFEDLEKQRPDFSENFNRLRLELENLEKEKGAVLRELGKIEGQIEGIRKMERPSNQIKVGFGELEKICKSARDSVSRILTLENIGEIKEKLKILFDELERIFSEPEKRENPQNEILEKLQNQNLELTSKLNVFEEKVSALNKKMDDLRKQDEVSGISAREVWLKAQRQRNLVNQLKNQISEFSLAEEKLKIREEDIFNRLKEDNADLSVFSEEKMKDFNLSKELEKIEFSGSLGELEGRIFRLRRELSAMGEVDEILIKEAKETEERHDFLSKELTDLEKAKFDLEKLIEELTEKIDNQFNNSLKEINEEFNRYFRIMFGGGKAHLVLSKPPKPKEEKKEEKEGEPASEKEGIDQEKKEEKEWEPGLEFNLELPKKKVNSLEALSGGERSLVSLSSLFAIVSVMHPPFAVLDEVDAALDETNARRFSKILSELETRTQFVVVTHNRTTMESAQILYGISVAEEGVSQAISLKLEE